MLKMKKILTLVLAAALLFALPFTTADAAYEGQQRVILGANLGDSEIDTVYDMFGLERGDVKELTVTIDEERSYLSGLVADSKIGSLSVSCAYIEVLEEGAGLDVQMENINWCTEDVYANVLITAGIYDAKVMIASPYPVSGTAALTGIYKAYEDISGESLDEDAKTVATEELVITSELADQIGSVDAAEIVNELKKILDETENMTDDQLRAEILAIAENVNVSLTETQIEQLISLVRQLEKLDTNALIDKVESLQDTIQNMAETAEKASGLFEKVTGFFSKIGDFFSNLFGGSRRDITANAVESAI